MHKVRALRRREEKEFHQVKPLELVWRHPACVATGWTSQNTIHVDDLARNFVMNPKNGLKCKAYYVAKDGQQDCELALILRYLLIVRPRLPAELDHREWQDVLRRSAS